MADSNGKSGRSRDTWDPYTKNQLLSSMPSGFHVSAFYKFLYSLSTSVTKISSVDPTVHLAYSGSVSLLPYCSYFARQCCRHCFLSVIVSIQFMRQLVTHKAFEDWPISGCHRDSPTRYWVSTSLSFILWGFGRTICITSMLQGESREITEGQFIPLHY